MPPSSADPRKQFILTTTGNFFGLEVPPSLADSAALNNFLDDGNEFVLCFSLQHNDLHLSNQVQYSVTPDRISTTHVWKCEAFDYLEVTQVMRVRR